MDEDVNMADYLKHIRDVHHRVFLTFKLYQKLMIALSPKHIGEKQAKKIWIHTKIMSGYSLLLKALRDISFL
jgi:hypothetical protein